MKSHECFYLNVDGKKYGPWLLSEAEKFKTISHKKGVKIEYVRLTSGWIEKPKRAIRKRDKSAPLFQGLNITFTRKEE